MVINDHYSFAVSMEYFKGASPFMNTMLLKAFLTIF